MGGEGRGDEEESSKERGGTWRWEANSWLCPRLFSTIMPSAMTLEKPMAMEAMNIIENPNHTSLTKVDITHQEMLERNRDVSHLQKKDVCRT